MPTSRITRLYEREWYESDDEVYNLGRDMLKAGMFEQQETGVFGPSTSSEAENLLEYFNKPYHWNKEHAWWVATEWPDDWTTWDLGKDSNWKVNTT